MKTITEIIACEWGTTPEEMLSKTREQPMADARMFLLFYLSYILKFGPTYTGVAFGLDHSSVCHAKKVVINYLDTDKVFTSHVNIVLEYLNNNKYLVEFPPVITKRKRTFDNYSFKYELLKANSVIVIKEKEAA